MEPYIWEYYTTTIECNKVSYEWTETLNFWANRGWELDQVVIPPSLSGYSIIIFKKKRYLKNG